MPERRTWKVSELTARIRELLESALPEVWVEGEVSNCHMAQSGHCYFTLKDAKSQIRCVCFRDQMRGMKFKPEDVHVKISFKPIKGRGRKTVRLYTKSTDEALETLDTVFDLVFAQIGAKDEDGFVAPHAAASLWMPAPI